jgi:pyrroline-5-carboxylate reductase
MQIGIIGVGKIASAVVEGLCTAGRKEIEIFLSPRNEENSRQLADKYNSVQRMKSNQEVLDAAAIIFIALRPAAAREILTTLQFDRRHTVVSFIPLIPYATLSELVGPVKELCRAIPLPGVMNHNCPLPLYRASEAVTSLFSLIGQPLPVENEQQLHALWTLTGLITPFYDLLQQLSEWTIAHGVVPETANTYIADLFQSLAYMAQQSRPPDFKELASHAATPNGMNEQAGREIREGGGHGLYASAASRLLERFPPAISPAANLR